MRALAAFVRLGVLRQPRSDLGLVLAPAACCCRRLMRQLFERARARGGLDQEDEDEEEDETLTAFALELSKLGTGDPCQLHATASRACLLRSID